VIDSSPKAGDSVAKGTKVSIVISTGEVELPDLVGMTTQEARRALLERDLGIKVDYQDSDKTPDTVIEQDPKAGKVPQGTTVRVIAAQAPPPPTETQTPTPTETTQPTPTDTPTDTSTDSGSIIPTFGATG
jgi:serine/threonine-protein kinase